MPTRSRKLGQELDSSLKHLSDAAGHALNLRVGGQLTIQQLEDVLAGIAVLAHAEIEGFIDRLFLGLLAGAVRPGNKSKAKPLIRARSYDHARSIVLGRDAAKDYVSWLPYSRTVDHAERLFRGGRPFTELAGSTRTAIQQLHHIRNALAHSSDRSKAMFKKHCVGNRALPVWQSRPAGFLRGAHSGGKTRIEHYIDELRTGMVPLAWL